ncbi:MAG: class I SAM-dependent methyltransferase [Lachnospiraceae bacterium]|nr:class I SAM-dependent methyltransferase [Lachnospiraceae bacterium]
MDSVDYYNKYANAYFDTTVALDMSDVLERFIDMLEPNATVLDLGCGSGRDSKILIENNFEVTLLDASSELAELADIYTGVEPLVMDMRDMDFDSVFDGIWACASLLHLPKDDMKDMLRKISDALKEGGICYLSVKKGDFEGFRQERYYSDYEPLELKMLLEDVGSFEDIEIWENEDARIEGQEWVNALIKKKG